MTHRDHPLQLLKQDLSRLVGYGVLGGLLAFSVSFVTPLQYSSTVRLLITQPNSVGVDAYTVLKANERIAQSISRYLTSSSYFESITAQTEGFDRGSLPATEYERRKYWEQAVETSVEPGSGLMTITIYHKDVKQAHNLVRAASNEVSKKAPNLFGAGVVVTELDSPLDSRWYTRPEFAKNTVLGVIAGALLSAAWIVFFGKR